jgi:hypothetical protein
MDDGEEKIEDPAELAQVRRQALVVHIESVLGGIILTLIAVLVP